MLTRPDDWAKIAGKKGERILYIKPIVASTPDEPPRIDRVVTTGQYLSRKPRGEGTNMSDVIETIRSSSSGTTGRADNAARGVRLVLDSSSRAQPDAFTNSEAFLAGISSCGVTLIEMHARDTGIALQGMDVTIEGVRAAAEPNRFSNVTMTFELAGVTQEQAEALVETYRGR